MGRILFFAILAVLGYLLFRTLTKAKPPSVDKDADAPTVEDMVACVRCGVNLPKSDAVESGSGFACREGERCQNIR